MAVEVEVVGNGQYEGARANINTYSVSEESTPIEASDTTGGVGQITFTAIDDPSRFGSMLLLNDTVKLTDEARGNTEGRVNAITSNDRILSISGDSRLGQLVVDKTATSVNGTLQQALEYYFSLADISTGIAIDAGLSTLPVVAPGWTGDVWTKIKELCVTVGAEVTLIRGNIVVRPVRVNDAIELNNISESWTVSNTDVCRQIEVYYYNPTYKTNELVYPSGGWNEDVTVYTIDAGQTIEVNIPVDVTVDSIIQPVPQTTVSKDETNSVYAVAGNDGLPIMPQQWLDEKGSITVEIGEDQASLDVTIVGAGGTLTKYAPYRIAVSAGPSDYYSSLRIRGNGMHYKQESIIVPTGIDPAVTSRDIGVTVDNKFVRTKSDASTLALDIAAKWASPSRTISVNRAVISSPGDGETTQFDYATFAEFDTYAAANGITTFTQFDTAWSGQTFADFDAYWYDLVDDQFAFQTFGNANGSRIQFRRAIYRIRSITITEANVSYVAEADTTFEDFDESAVGMTFAQFDTSFSGLTFNDFSLIPLPVVKAEYDR